MYVAVPVGGGETVVDFVFVLMTGQPPVGVCCRVLVGGGEMVIVSE